MNKKEWIEWLLHMKVDQQSFQNVAQCTWLNDTNKH